MWRRHQSLFSPAAGGRFGVLVLVALLMQAAPSAAQQGGAVPDAAPGGIAQSIVHLVARIAPEPGGSSLGPVRAGNGVIIDSSGLVVTIGYLVRGAFAIEVTLADGRQVAGSYLGYDHESGFGLIRAQVPPGIEPMRLGDSDAIGEGDPSLVLAADGPLPALPVSVVSRRAFAGYWEYLLDSAIFTAPPQPRFGGAALVGADGRLVGIGSLLVSDAAGPNQQSPGNMFVPINLLKPMMAELMEIGRPASKGPAWLGITTLEVDNRVVVRRVNQEGPAARAGIRPGDLILGVGEEPVGDTIDFLRKVRALGGPGTPIPLVVVRTDGDTGTLQKVTVTAASRYDSMDPARGL